MRCAAIQRYPFHEYLYDGIRPVPVAIPLVVHLQS